MRMKAIVREPTVTPYGKTLQHKGMVSRCQSEAWGLRGEIYHGVGCRSADCWVMNTALIPRIVPAVTSMMMVQKLSCASGQ